MLSAAKVAHGHAEAGAGVVGVMQALSGLTHSLSPIFATLRTVNAYVAESFSIASATVAARQDSAMICVHGKGIEASGVSSFAYQGTNAHAILGAAEREATSVTQQAVPWHKYSLWIVPAAHALVSTARADRRKVEVQSATGGAALAYLWDHRVGGRALMPGTGHMELSTAVARSVMSEASSAQALSLVGLAFTVPQELSYAHASVVCKMELVRGSFEIADATPRPHVLVHGAVEHSCVAIAKPTVLVYRGDDIPAYTWMAVANVMCGLPAADSARARSGRV